MTTPTAPKMMLLPVVLTEREKLALFDEVSLMLTEVEKLEAERKRLPEAIKALLASIHMKNHAKAAGVIEREVEVFEVAHAFTGRVSTYRVDTGDLVKERDMDPDERQLTLGAPAARAPDERTEEQRAAGTPEEAEAMRDSRIAEDLDLGDEGAGATVGAGSTAPAPGELAPPKKLLKAPKGARQKKLKIEDARGNPLPPPAPAADADDGDGDELAF